MLLEVPEYAQRRAAIENHSWRMSLLAGAATRTGCTMIPVVVHVVHRTQTESISDAQIASQMTVLNADFRRRNADVSDAPPVFRNLATDARIQFRLATTDPSGNPTNGITRTQTSVNGFTDDDAVKSAASGGADPWPADEYLNVWVCRLAGGLLGYAQFPGGPAATDGVVVTHTGFGTTGTAAAPFNGGRTLVHEIGHWLNLRHIWGDDDTACNGDDLVADTPNQGGGNTGQPTFPTISCNNGPNGDMFMNYMDYVDDAAMVMFTTGQVDRMQAALDGPRSSLGEPTPCGSKPLSEDLQTIKVRDDEPRPIKRIDDPIATIKFADEPIGTANKLVDDPIGTVNKWVDDPVGTLRTWDDPVGTNKGFDDVKTPALDPGFADPWGPVVNPAVNPGAGGGRTPFVLATPHHSTAWQQSFPGAAQATLAAYEQQLARYEEVLQQYAERDAAGELDESEAAALGALHAEYMRLAQEYQQMTGGQA